MGFVSYEMILYLVILPSNRQNQVEGTQVEWLIFCSGILVHFNVLFYGCLTMDDQVHFDTELRIQT